MAFENKYTTEENVNSSLIFRDEQQVGEWLANYMDAEFLSSDFIKEESSYLVQFNSNDKNNPYLYGREYFYLRVYNNKAKIKDSEYGSSWRLAPEWTDLQEWIYRIEKEARIN